MIEVGLNSVYARILLSFLVLREVTQAQNGKRRRRRSAADAKEVKLLKGGSS